MRPAVEQAGTAPLRVRWGCLRAFVWRFGTLPYSQRLFGGLHGPLVLARRFRGFALHVDVSRSSLQRLLFLEGERFVAERGLLGSLLGPGMHFVDVGANLGYYLLLAESVVGAQGRVSCFEPEPDNLRELRRNVQVNGLGNVEVFAAAAGAEDGTASLRTGINGSVAAGGGDLEVPLRRLDSVLTRRVDFLKIDVEGYEGHVLAGAERILREDRPRAFVEIHPALLAPPWTVDGILDTLRALYPHLALWEPAPADGLVAKARARYLGRQVAEIHDREALLAACRTGARQAPFWAVCTSRPLGT